MKSPISCLKNFMEIIYDNVIEPIINFQKQNSISIDEFLKIISPKIDDEIIHHAKSRNTNPLGGEITFQKDTDSDDVIVSWVFYFSDEQNQATQISSKEMFKKNFFDDSSYEKIINALTFNIEPPTV